MDSLDGFPELMSTNEAAKALGVSAATIRRWLSEGTLFGIQVGAKWIVPRVVVQDQLRPVTIYLASGRSMLLPARYPRRKKSKVEDGDNTGA